MLRSKKGGVRGDNVVARTLNKPVHSSLTRPLPRRWVTGGVIAALLAAWGGGIYALGFADGTMLFIGGVALWLGDRFVRRRGRQHGERLREHITRQRD